MLQQVLVALAFDQQVERSQDREARLDQGQKLLVKNQESAVPELATPGHAAGGQQAPRLHPIDEVPLLGVAVPHLRFRETMLDVLLEVALLVGDFDQEFCHAAIPLRG